MRIDLTGKLALVTGGARGIGRGIVERFVESGAQTIINYNRSKKEAEQLILKLNKKGAKVISIKADVSNKLEVVEMFNTIQKEFGHLDILVNNAGSMVERCIFKTLSEEVFDKTLDINVKSVFLCSQAALPLMQKSDNGRIINISSVAARSGGGGGAGHYAMAKGAVNVLTKALAKEYSQYRITVNAIEPGLIETDFHREFTSQEQFQKFLGSIPLGRSGKPSDIASIVCFIASEQAGYITGSFIAVDGGLS